MSNKNCAFIDDRMEDNVEQEVHARMCSSCPNVRRCNEETEPCDGYVRAIKQAQASLKGGK